MILPALTEATSPFFRPIKYSLFPPLGLATLAGYLPPDTEVAIHDDEHLPVRAWLLQGRDQPTAHRELLQPGRRQRFAARRSDDAVVGGVGRVSPHAVTIHQTQVRNAQGRDVLACLVVQRLEAFDRQHLA